jgi:superfamily II DNA or RNA helicase
MTTFDLAPELLSSPDFLEVGGVRPYQRDMLVSVSDGWMDEYCRTQLIVAATGTGKTIVMGGLARTFVKSGQRALMLAHTDELISQAQDKFSRLTGMPAAREKAADHASLNDNVVVGSVQTMRGLERLQSWPRDHFGLVMVDEAHRTLAKSYMEVLNHFESARVVGVTATADRGDKRELGQFYERLAYDYPMVKACHDGWLVRPVVQTLPLQIDLNANGAEKIKIKRGMDGAPDLDMTEVSHRIEPFLGDLAAAIWQHAKDRRILGFAPSIDIAQKMTLACRKAGFTSVDWVAGEDRDRHRKIAEYKQGKIRVLWNAMLLTEGFDHDEIDCMVPLRPTLIRALYVQMVGRGTRPLSSIVPALNAATDAEERNRLIRQSAKPHVLLLDPLWLFEQHDLTTPASLVSKNIDEQQAMKGKEGDLLQIQEECSRNLMETLRKKILANANKRAARIDPFTFGVVMGDEELATYQPETLWDARQPTLEQLQVLVDNGIEAEQVKWRGQAARILKIIDERRERGLCSIRLMNWLRRHDIEAALMTHEQATKHQRRLFATGFRG